MQRKHYVEKSGYWVYDSHTKSVIHQLGYPYHTSAPWVYTGSPGYIVTEDDEILDFYPDLDPLDHEREELNCRHSPKEYVGFTDKFSYCEKCGVKL